MWSNCSDLPGSIKTRFSQKSSTERCVLHCTCVLCYWIHCSSPAFLCVFVDECIRLLTGQTVLCGIMDYFIAILRMDSMLIQTSAQQQQVCVCVCDGAWVACDSNLIILFILEKCDWSVRCLSQSGRGLVWTWSNLGACSMENSSVVYRAR